MKPNDIIRDYLAKYPTLTKRSVARIILGCEGEVFDNSLEKIRSRIRYVTGSLGVFNRSVCKDIIERSENAVMPNTWRIPRTDYRLNPGLWLVMADVHVPFHEPLPIESTIKHAQLHKIDGILFNGDLQDCAAVSFWMSNRKRDFDKEVHATIGFLDFMRHEFPDAEMVWKPGNHEYRLPRYFASKAPELIGTPLIAMEEALGLEARDIEFLDYKQKVMAGEALPILHGDEVPRISRAVNPARGLFLRTKSYSMCSHCHTTSEHTEKNIHGTILTTWSTGCLCDLNPDYSPHGNNWNWGFALVNTDKSGGFEVENRRILPNGTVV